MDAVSDKLVKEEEKVEEDNVDLPVLTSIWDRPMLNKTIAVYESGKSYAGWTCGWCPPQNDGAKAKPFWGCNATKALCHVAKISDFDIWPC